jgi:hypothetical protein
MGWFLWSDCGEGSVDLCGGTWAAADPSAFDVDPAVINRLFNKPSRPSVGRLA